MRAGQKLTFEFTRWREAVVWFCLIFYLFDIAIDFAIIFNILDSGVTATDKKKEPNTDSKAWFVGFCIIVPNAYAGYKSLQWYLRAFRDSPQEKSVPWLWILRVVFFPLSLVLRYIDVLKLGYQSRRETDRDASPAPESASPVPPRQSKVNFSGVSEGGSFSSTSHFKSTKEKALGKDGGEEQMVAYLEQSSEVAMLRLFVIFLEDAPICVMMLMRLFGASREIIIKDSKLLFVLAAVVAKLALSMTCGVVHFISITKIAWHAHLFSQYGREVQNHGPSTLFNNRASRKTRDFARTVERTFMHSDDFYGTVVQYRTHNRSRSDTQMSPHSLSKSQPPHTPLKANTSLPLPPQPHRRTQSQEATVSQEPPSPPSSSDLQQLRVQNNMVTNIEEFEKRANLTPIAHIVLYFWQFLLIGTRVVMFSLFASMFNLYVLVLAFGIWCFNTVAIWWDVRYMTLANCFSFGGVYLFTFVSTSDEDQMMRLMLYYVFHCVLCLTVAVLWWYKTQLHYRVLGFGLLVGGLTASVVVVSVYYLLFHPNRSYIRQDKKCGGLAKHSHSEAINE